MIGNGHHIKMTDNGVSPWDSSFEAEFNNADGNYPQIIEWLERLERCDPPFERPVEARMVAQLASNQQFTLLIECLVSLAARSPMYREKGVALAEHFRGPLPEQERNRLIGANISRSLKNAVQNIGGRGKILVLYSPEREFIFGDGFFHNLTVQGEHWNNPKILAPLTPWMSVLFTRPMRYTENPRLVTLINSPEETDALNFAIQVYARNAIYYRSERPQIEEPFAKARHMVFADHRNSVDQLIRMIPGIPPRDTSLDFLDDILASKEAS